MKPVRLDSPAFAYRGEKVVQTLARACVQIGQPKTIRVEQSDATPTSGPVPRAFAAVKSKFRAGCLNAYWFHTRADARENLEHWRSYDNRDRVCRQLGYVLGQRHGSGFSYSPLFMSKAA